MCTIYQPHILERVLVRYKTLVQEHIDNIRTGTLVAGQRMPSLRQFCTQHGLSMSTALNCYRALERDGWIVAQPQSGFYVRGEEQADISPAHPQFISRVATAASLHRATKTDEFIDYTGPFGVSQLGPRCLSNEALKKSLKRGLTRSDSQLLGYPDPQGFAPLRQALAKHFSKSGFAFNPDDLVLTSGCIDAVRMALLACTQPGDQVAVSSPCFGGLLQLLAGLNRKIVEIPCTQDGIDLDQLQQLLQDKQLGAGLFSSSHMNPQGTSLTQFQKQRLAELANRYKVPMIEDDVYAELSFDRHMPLPAKQWDNGGYLLWCGSVSKSLAPGLRIGWCLPGRYAEIYTNAYHIENLGLSELAQVGLADYIQSGQYARHLTKVRARLLQHTHSYRTELLTLLPTGTAVSQPSGGMVLWLQVPGLNSEQLQRDALKLGIEVRAGGRFTTRRLYHDCFRLNAGWELNEPFDNQRSVLQALEQLAKVVHQNCQ